MIIKETLNKGALSGGQTKKNHQNVIKRVIHGYCHDAWLADFSYPWNVNLGNYSSWLVTWMFCVTREELGLFTDIRACTTLFWVIFETVFQMVRVLYREWLSMWFAIWSLDLAIDEFAFFKHNDLWRKSTLSKSVSYLLIFVIRENEIFYLWSVILYFFRFWVVPVIPPVRVLYKLYYNLADRWISENKTWLINRVMFISLCSSVEWVMTTLLSDPVLSELQVQKWILKLIKASSYVSV